MKIQEMIKLLEKTYPLKSAAHWDNPGLRVGRRDKEARKILLALDASEDVIREAKEWGADLLLTHHPLMMSGIKNVNEDTVTGRKILELVQADISHYAMHTNFDVVTMAGLSSGMLGLTGEEILEVQSLDENGNLQGFGRVGSLPASMTIRELSKLVKETFDLDHVRVFGDPERVVQRIAVSPGSGKSMIASAIGKGAEALVSGDFGHHDGLDAVDAGLVLIDAGHYGLEHIFMGYMEKFCRTNFPDVEVKLAAQKSPFEIL